MTHAQDMAVERAADHENLLKELTDTLRMALFHVVISGTSDEVARVRAALTKAGALP